MADDPVTAALKNIASALSSRNATGGSGPAGPAGPAGAPGAAGAPGSTGPAGPAGPTNITALTGDVTASGSGSVSATIAANAVTNAKCATMPTATFKGNVSGGPAVPADLTVGNMVSALGIITQLTSDVTAGPGSGSQAATIASGAVSLAKMANLAADSIIGNNTGSPATPLALTAAQVLTLIGLKIPAYGEMGEVNEGAGTTITVVTGGAPTGTFVGWVTATPDTFDPSSNITFTNNGTADRLTCGTNGGGVYRVSAAVACSTTAAREIQMAVFVNNIRDDSLRMDMTGQGTGNDFVIALTGFVTLAATDFIDLRFSSDTNNTNVVLHHVNLALSRIG